MLSNVIRIRVLLVILLSGCSFWAVANKVLMPVIVGGNDNLDACPGLGVVSNLKSKSKGFLSVRSGANLKYKVIDKLREGQKVFICSKSKDGNWFGVVYSRGNIDDCGVTTPITPSKPYKGNCKSGWVNVRWITLLAG